ncbi:coat protein [Auricularia heimuer mycovirgavirus 1]|nr:coat protein [Auricularia heimuer mycovirgavirus 1]
MVKPACLTENLLNMPNVNCVICGSSINDSVADIGTHVTSVHGFNNDAVWPNNTKDANGVRVVRAPDGSDADLTDDNDVVRFIKAHSVTRSPTPPPVNPVSNARQGILARCGITTANLNTIKVKTIGGGGVATPEQVSLLWDAIKKEVCECDRGSVFVNLAWEFVNHDATDEVDSYGDIWIEPLSTTGGTGKWVNAFDLLKWWREAIESKTGRSSKATFRQLARLWAPDIFRLINNNPDFAELRTMGTAISQKFSIDAAHYYAVLSFFPAMKPFSTWTAAEAAAYEAHTNSVVKQPPRGASAAVNFVGLDPSGTRRAVMNAGIGLNGAVPQSSQQAANNTGGPAFVSSKYANLFP